jgi:hypothetical protein
MEAFENFIEDMLDDMIFEVAIDVNMFNNRFQFSSLDSLFFNR